jgi:hypothetical protein
MVSTPEPPDLVKVAPLALTIHPFAFEMDFRKIFPVAEEVRFAFKDITPPYILINPATATALFRVIFPALLSAPIVKPFPLTLEVIALLMTTAKLLVFPTIVKEPLLRKELMSLELMVELAVTVIVPALKVHPVLELVAEETVKVCAKPFPEKVKKNSKLKKEKTELLPGICLLFI